MSGSLTPRSRKTFPLPLVKSVPSNMELRFSLGCFVSRIDQLQVGTGRLDALHRLLLKYMKDVEIAPKLISINGPIGIPIKRLDDFDDTGITFERLRLIRHLPYLRQSQCISDAASNLVRKLP